MSVKKIIIIVAVVLVLVLGAGGFFVVKMLSGGEEKEVTYEEMPKFYFEVVDQYSNVKDSKKICKVSLTVETVDETLLATIQAESFKVADAISLIIRSSKEEQLLGEEGQLFLQEEIKRSLNERFNTDKITNVYFKELIIQG
jgi:flagellar FliL protein